MSDITQAAESTGRPPAAERRRQASIDAFIDLALEHGEPPSPEQVAERSGVSRATFFRYFSTLNELRIEAAARLIERFPELVTIPDLGNGTRQQRIERLVDSRLELHERVHVLERIPRSDDGSAFDTPDVVGLGRALFADQVRAQFAEELAPLSADHAQSLVAAISVLTSFEGWQQFRASYKFTAPQTAQAWVQSINALLTDAADQRRRRGH